MWRTIVFIFGLCISGLTTAPAAAAQTLQWPVDCRLGQTCWIQNWVDADTGAGRADPLCGPLTYDGHDGIDIRVPWRAMGAGVAVRAPAAGVVLGARNNAPEGSVPTNGQDCGNGMRIDHGGGLETQMCHMAQGSISVRTGQSVTAGQTIGRIGLSGRTEFPHLHVTVRRNGVAIDPFTNTPMTPRTCSAGARAATGLFAPPLTYTDSAIIDVGFVEQTAARATDIDRQPPATGARSAPALLGYVMILGPRAGATTRVRVVGPDNAVFAEREVRHDRDQAQYALFAGRSRPPASFAPGAYRLEARYTRPDGTALSRTTTLQVR